MLGSQERFLSCPLFEVLFHGTRGNGKGLPLDETVYTPMGPVPISRLKVGSHVLCPDGTKSSVIGVFPQGVRPVYRLTFDDGSQARCDDGHIWAIHVQGEKTKRPYPYRLITMPGVLDRFQRGKRLHVPTMDVPANLRASPRRKEWPVPPYLLGLLLGDGCFTQGRVMFCTIDDELADAVLDHGLRETGFDSGRNIRQFLGRIPWSKQIKALGLSGTTSGTKFVPRMYMQTSTENREAILQGLLDTDGTVDGHGHVFFCSKSRQLAEDVRELAWSLGGKATLTEKLVKGGLYFNVYIQAAGKFRPFRMTRKAEKVVDYQHPHLWRRIVDIEELPAEETVCIKIDHPLGLFMTRDYVVTHNSDSLLMDFARDVGQGHGEAWTGILFRQTYPQLADIIAKSQKWFRQIFPEATFNVSKNCWTWPTGERLFFRHMEKPSDYWSYHGHSYPWIGWEELSNWHSPDCYTRMFSCCRSATPGVPRRIRANTNPYGVGANWIKARFQLAGQWWKTIVQMEPTDHEGNKEHPRAAIYGNLRENKALLEADPEYEKTISAAAENPAMRAAWLEGSWDITSGGMFDDVWSPGINDVPDFHVPESWRIDRAFDWGSSRPFSVGWYAQSDGSDLKLDDGRVISTVRGDLFRVREWYGWTGQPNQGLKMMAADVAAGIVERELMWGWRVRGQRDCRVSVGVADSAIWTVENGPSVEQDMRKPVRIDGFVYPGIRWTKADKRPGSRKMGWEMVRKMMAAARKPGPRIPRESPGLFVVGKHNPQFLRTVLSLPRSEKDPDDVNTDAEDHTGDEVRYRCRSSGRVARSGSTEGMW